MSENFNHDYNRSKTIEHNIARHYEALGWTVLFSKRTGWKFYDLLIMRGKENITIEIKYQPGVLRTGDCVVEYKCNNKSSGITTTIAQYWIEALPDPITEKVRYFRILTDKLKEIIKDEKYKLERSGGSLKNRTRLYVFDFETYIDFFEEFDLITTKEVLIKTT